MTGTDVGRAARWGALEKIIAGAAAVAIAAALLIAVVSIARQNQVLKSTRQQACIARIQGTTLGLAFEALAAPPAPNPAREQTVKRGLAEARKLQHLDKFCP